LKIRIFYDNIDFRVRGWRKIEKLVEKVISKENKISGDLNFIVTNDKTLKKLNNKYLKHNFNTDVISFNYEDQSILFGEIYVSIDTVKRNAKNYKVSYRIELVRVMIHGVLHICRYEDKNSHEKEKMSELEDWWLRVYDKM
jgi:probable rRNA maturation factor